MTKLAAFLLAFFPACLPGGYSSPTDASIDVAIDATREPIGCERMGNLPNSRTATHVDGDPLEPVLIDEVQDNIIGHKRKQWTRNFMPVWTVAGSWVGTNGTAGSGLYATWKSSGVTPGRFDIPFDDGDRITGLRFQAFGNASVSFDGDVRYFASMAAAAAATGSTGQLATIGDLTRAATWATKIVTPFTPQVLAAGGLLTVLAEADAAGYCMGIWTATFDRL